MSDMIQPRVLKGFRDILPAGEMVRQDLMDSLAGSFRRFGFVPIDTPVLEYAEILLGKSGGETEKQVYRFTDHGKREVAMRFDLTVPFARFMAEHSHELYLPFKRYHMAKVWRGENTQRGRYREFIQADFDLVGADNAAADFEILALIYQTMTDLGVADSKIHCNNRAIFNRFLERAGVLDKSVEILRIVDKLAKIGKDDTQAQLSALCGPAAADQILEFIDASGDFAQTLERITALAGGPNPDSDRLAEVWAMAEACGLTDRLVLAPYITRGLDYYTGIVFETFLDAIPEIGSVCSGGRYNNLASLYTKLSLPGVGASIGLDRLVAALEAIDRLPSPRQAAPALVLNLDPGLGAVYQQAAHHLRQAGLACEVYADERRLAQQYAYAEKKGCRFVLLHGKDDAPGQWQAKDLKSQDSRTCSSLEALTEHLRAALA